VVHFVFTFIFALSPSPFRNLGMANCNDMIYHSIVHHYKVTLVQQIEEDSVRELLLVMGDMDKLYNGKSKRKDLQVPWPYRGIILLVFKLCLVIKLIFYLFNPIFVN